MSGIAKTILGIGFISAIVWALSSGSQLINKVANITMKITGYGVPKLSNWVLTLPIILQFNNPSPFSISVDNVSADIYVQKGSKWEKVGNVNQPLTIDAGGISDRVITPTIDLKKFFREDILQTLFTTVQTRAFNTRIDVTATYNNVVLPTQTFEKTINV